MPPNQLRHSPPRKDCSGMTAPLVRLRSPPRTRQSPPIRTARSATEVSRGCPSAPARACCPAARTCRACGCDRVTTTNPPRRAGTTPVRAVFCNAAGMSASAQAKPATLACLTWAAANCRSEIPAASRGEYRAHEFGHRTLGRREGLEGHHRLDARIAPRGEQRHRSAVRNAEQAHARHIPAAPAEIVDHRRDIARLEGAERNVFARGYALAAQVEHRAAISGLRQPDGPGRHRVRGSAGNHAAGSRCLSRAADIASHLRPRARRR